MKIKKVFKVKNGGAIIREFDSKCKDAFEFKKQLGPKLFFTCYKYYFWNEYTEEWTLIK